MNKLKLIMKDILLVSIFLIIYSCSSNSDENTPGPEPEIVSTIKFISSPQKTTDHNRIYRYSLRTEITDGDEVTYKVSIPSWLNFNVEQNLISGVADWGNVSRNFNISVTATNNIDEVTQSYQLEVKLGEIICNQNFGDPDMSEYILPFQEGESYEVNQSYCPTNTTWGHHDWFAYDFDMPFNTNIIASRSGEVIASQDHNPDVSDCSGGKENWVFILHDDGTVMQYVHLKQNSIVVNKGDLVEQGQYLGLSGNSGCSSGPHTHVALFKDRTNYDRQSTIPLNYKNAEGSLDTNNGLIYKERYKALTY